MSITRVAAKLVTVTTNRATVPLVVLDATCSNPASGRGIKPFQKAIFTASCAMRGSPTASVCPNVDCGVSTFVVVLTA
jgi:hypothetical protein